MDFHYRDTGAPRINVWLFVVLPFCVFAVMMVLRYLSDTGHLDSLDLGFRIPVGDEMGIIENCQLFFLFFSLVLSGILVKRVWAYDVPLLKVFCLVWFLGCVFVIGEEMSWGQHFVGWKPTGWMAAVNNQNETNLHNIIWVFDEVPRTLFQFGMLASVFLVVFSEKIKSKYPPFVALILPTREVIPVLVLFGIDKTMKVLRIFFPILTPVAHGENRELTIYMFVFLYTFSVFKRIKAKKQFLKQS